MAAISAIRISKRLLISVVFTATTPDPTGNGEERKPFTAPGY
jgi:hypothetical protein